MNGPVDWTAPLSWLDEHVRQQALAKALREEAAMYLQRCNELAADIAKLHVARWSCIEKAAAIERGLRGM